MANTKNTKQDKPDVAVGTTEATEEKKPRMSRAERLRMQLAEAEAKEKQRVLKKVDGLQEKLDAKLKQRDKLNDEIDAIVAELEAARGEAPITTDGVGEVNIRNRQGTDEPEPEDEPEDDEPEDTDENAGA